MSSGRSHITTRRTSLRLSIALVIAAACGIWAGTGFAADDPPSCPAGHSLVAGSCEMDPVAVTICHRNGSGYVRTDTTATEILRTGGHADDVEDVIPPFSYVDPDGIELQFPGLNWDLGTERLLDGGCIAMPPDCADGTHLDGMSCIPDAPSCPSGFHVEGALCVDGDPVCAVGEHNEDGRCVVDPPACPDGTHDVAGDCEQDAPTCEPGFVLDSAGECVTVTDEIDEEDDEAEDTSTSSGDDDNTSSADGTSHADDGSGTGTDTTAVSAVEALQQHVTVTPAGELPFTGIDATGSIIALVLSGLSLLGLGLALRRRAY